MEVRLSSPALVRPGLTVEPTSCQTKFLSENWRFQWEEEIPLDYEELTDLAFRTTALLSSNQMELGSARCWRE